MKENAFFSHAFQIAVAMEVVSNSRFRDLINPKCCSLLQMSNHDLRRNICLSFLFTAHGGKIHLHLRPCRFITTLIVSFLLGVLSPQTGNFQVCSCFCNSHFLFYECQDTFISFRFYTLRSSLHWWWEGNLASLLPHIYTTVSQVVMTA